MARSARYRNLVVVVAAICAFGSVVTAEDATRVKLSSLPSFAPSLGAGWHGPSGLVVDDVHDLSKLSGYERTVAEGIVKLLPKGVTAVGEYDYTRRDVPRVVSVRVFLFDDTAAARAWWKEKYERPGWQKHYEKLPGIADRALRSKELSKDFVLKDNVWITAHQLHKGDEYRRALMHYLKHVTSRASTQRAQ